MTGDGAAEIPVEANFEVTIMPVSPELLEILVCPETRQPVVLASPELLERVNQRVRAGELRNRGGERVQEEIQEALVREDGRVLYRVDDSIPVMLIEESIPLDA